MEFRNFIERTLYHGTIVDNEPSIRQIGLYGQMGDFQNWAGYDDIEHQERDEVVYMSDKQRLGKAVTAMVHHIAKKLGKGFHDVTDDDIRNHGLLCVMHDMSGPQDSKYPDVEQRPEEDYYGSQPRGAEPNDYYASSARPDQYVRGAGLLRLLKRYGEWPRYYGGEGRRSREKQLRGMVIASILRHHPDYPKDEVIKKVQKLPAEEFYVLLKRYVPQWQR